MKKIMSCEQFAREMDAYLDSELDGLARAAFLEHARTCPDCGERLEFSTKLMTMCAELDEDICMPLEGQAAWRKAIRSETGRERKRLPAFVRGISTIAAALLVIAGGTFLSHQMGALSLNTASQVKSEAPVMEYAAPMAGMGHGNNMPQMTAMSKGAILERDGSFDEVPLMDEAEVDPFAESDADEVQSGGSAAAAETAPDYSDMADSGFDPNVPAEQVKEIRYASREIETSAYDDDYATVKDLIDEYRGRIDDESGYGAPIEPGQRYGRSAYLSARVPAGDTEAFLTSLDVVGTIVGRSASRQEITRQYYDASARLNSQLSLRSELEAMRQEAQTVAEKVELQRELANVQAEIESLQGEINSWDSQVDYSTVNITLHEVADKLVVQKIDSASLMERVKTGFADSINILSAFAQDMLVFLVTYWPWVLLAVIVLWVLSASIRRRKRR